MTKTITTKVLKTRLPATTETAPKAKTVVKAAKPIMTHQIASSYVASGGVSSLVNSRKSRTPIDFSKFGSLSDAPMSDRDHKSLSDLRAKFQGKEFVRGNLDAGVIRRLGERGMIVHVSGTDVGVDTKFKLAARAVKNSVRAPA